MVSRFAQPHLLAGFLILNTFACVYLSDSQSVPRNYTPRTGSLEARIQAIEADNQRILGNIMSRSRTDTLHAACSTVVTIFYPRNVDVE